MESRKLAMFMVVAMAVVIGGCFAFVKAGVLTIGW